MSKVEDLEQTVIYIPYDGGDESEEDIEPSLPSPPLQNDLENGPQLRLDAYKAAWTRCLDRVKFVIAEVYSPVVSSVLDCLRNIHVDVMPGLPFPELPVITVTDLSGGSLFLDHLGKRLDLEVSEDGEAALTMVNHLYPNDCLNLTTAMKNLISGFIGQDVDALKRKSAASLAQYDLNILQAWIDAIEDQRPNLVVFLHEFEQLDKNVVQDMFYICSLQIPRLPMTFILSLSTPSSSSYLQASLTRSTLTLLRAYHFLVPSGLQVLDAVLFKTFFDPSFEPLLLPGPNLLEFIQKYHTRHNPSLDMLLTILQIAHTKHYASDVFSLLSNVTPRISPRLTPAELSFLEALLGRLHAPGISKQTTSDWRAQSHSPDILLQAVDNSRESFSRHARRTKLGFNLLRIVIQFLSLSKKDKLLDRWRGAAAISKVLDGDGVNGLASLLKKLPSADLKVLLGELHEYLQNVPEEIRDAELASRNKIVRFRSTSHVPVDEVAEWLEGYLADILQPFEKSTPLWHVWYTGQSPFPSELVNPALRSSIVSGVLFPHSYTGQETADDEDEDLQTLPDTAILFKGYTKAGKMINVYDWFDAFRVVLEGQLQSVLTTTATPAKGGKGKGKKSEPEPEAQERWRLGVQARFVRALHELDFVGFIKHTSRGGGGRKGEYVLRTVLGVVD